MEIFSIILGILEFLTYLFEKVGISQLGTFLSSFCFGLSDYFNSHQIMFSVCSLGSLLATIIFCRKELRNLPSYISKVIRYPSTNPEILEKFKRFCVLVMPYAAIYLLLTTTHKSLGDFLPNQGIWPWVPTLVSSFVVPIILIVCDRKKSDGETRFDLKNDCIIGFFQLLGFIPGVGRFAAFFGTMRYLGYSYHQAFRYYILTSIPLLLESFLMHSPGVTYPLPLFFREELDIPVCLITLICIVVIQFFFLKLADWFWKRFSLTVWSILCIAFGLFNLSHLAMIRLGELFFIIWK